MSFVIEKGNNSGTNGKLFLVGSNEHSGICYQLSSVVYLLDSDFFRKNDPKLIPIFEKAKEMMKQGKEGPC